MTSQGAKGGFANELELLDLFKNFDPLVFPFIDAFGYKLDEIKEIRATKFDPGHKPDLKLEFVGRNGALLGVEKISVKLQSAKNGFNQVDRGWIETRYRRLWPQMPDLVVKGLRLFTGEDKPLGVTRNNNRMFMDELPHEHREAILHFFSSNLTQVISDVLAGRDEARASWLLVKDKSQTSFEIRRMDSVIKGAASGGVGLTPKGSIRLGLITAQRKGGDGGAASAMNLQFKANPTELIRAAK